MKKIAIIIALGLVSFAASAQLYQSESLAVPSVLAGGTTNLATAPSLDVRKQSNVALAFTIAPITAGGTNVYTFHKSLDGTYYDATSTIAFTVAGTDGTVKTAVTNISCAGIGYLKLYSIVTTGTTITNTAVKYAVKINAP
jgi:hypothetical protein